GTFAEFPIRFIAEFYRNHGLLSVRHRPTWRVIAGGSRCYVQKLVSQLRGNVQVNSPVESLRRVAGGVELRVRGENRPFDQVILACHADQALRLVAEPRPVERELLMKFPYQANDGVLHTEESVLPPRRGAWAAWNYRIPRGQADAATLTYNMNILQGLKKRHTYCVTLNSTAEIDPRRILGRYEYHHPVFTTERGAAQQRHLELVGLEGLSYCGAYWGNGFHEDGVNSALAVCLQLDPECLTCTAASTRV
ncbi:MAG: FAD-dependent oxidoreductase, partial [Planctomycetaceae bacterium]